MKKLLLSMFLLSLLNVNATEVQAEITPETWQEFSVEGERLENVLLPNYKLAWMKGTQTGRYLQEYVLENENIESWQEGYIAIERIPYPSAEIKKGLEEKKLKLSEIGLAYYMESTDKICQIKNHKMSSRVNAFNGSYMAISGGFCEKFGDIAPYGEGAAIGFIEGKDFLFRVQYGWRPKDEAEKSLNLPYRITPEKIATYLLQYKKMNVCNNGADKSCD